MHKPKIQLAPYSSKKTTLRNEALFHRITELNEFKVQVFPSVWTQFPTSLLDISFLIWKRCEYLKRSSSRLCYGWRCGVHWLSFLVSMRKTLVFVRNDNRIVLMRLHNVNSCNCSFVKLSTLNVSLNFGKLHVFRCIVCLVSSEWVVFLLPMF